MELSIKTNEKDILSIMRWMGGGSEWHIAKNYKLLYIKNILCPCTLVGPTIMTNHIQITMPVQKRRTNSNNRKMSNSQNINTNNNHNKNLNRNEQQLFKRRITYMSSSSKNTTESTKIYKKK